MKGMVIRLGTSPVKDLKDGKDGMMMDRVDFKDKRLQCADCGSNFTFSAGEQKYYWSKGLSVPKRCLSCRQRRKLTLVKEGGEQ